MVLVDTGSLYTCLTVKSLEVFVGEGNVIDNAAYRFLIQGQSTVVECRVSRAHFKDVNILGANAMRKLKLSITVDWNKNRFQLIQIA